jgi:rare lipoprotein A (peptidoglycan hydrolase)
VVFSGEATYYDLPGAKTASGQKFDPNRTAAAMTADKAKLGETVTVTYAHPDKKGNTVTNSISVVANDRDPFYRDANGKANIPLQPAPGRVIDLTPAAFIKLVGTIKPGNVHVTVTVPNE